MEFFAFAETPVAGGFAVDFLATRYHAGIRFWAVLNRITFPCSASSSGANLPESASLLVSGTIAYDDIITPRGSGSRLLGGSATYAALAASFFAETCITGLVGQDFDPADRQRLEAHGVDVSGMYTNATADTFFWRGKYHANYNHRETLETRLGVNVLPRPALSAKLCDTRFLVLANDAPELQLAVLEQMNALDFVLADTMNLWIETQRDGVLRVASRADIFVVNDGEAAQLSGEHDTVAAGHHLLRTTGARSVLVKKGEHGALLFHREGLFALPAYPVTELHDPTGAGDSFAGALAGVLAARGRTDFDAVKTAMLYATAVASLTVESFSCDRLESAGAAEIEKRAAFLREMTRLP